MNRLGWLVGKAVELAERFDLQVLAPTRSVPRRARILLLKLGGIKIGRGSHFAHSTILVNKHIRFGTDCFVNTGCRLDPGDAQIEIGDNVLIGPGVIITAASHRMGSHRRRGMEAHDQPIRIGAGSWIGAGAVVLPGVTVGAGCVVAAGAVVTKDCEPDALYTGVPARFARQLAN
ncbi:acyltransferase [Jatrophihabitans telluris]|uniref:Acyltransferase n=1 Tax=Jatrophihabitans telluris TaxID=2038343 RepID=A0ABY4QYB2_9ACTN|nr:acyltransferase [Jatrophihabitans telluris]UQX87879.1 acyltransferase [Jatrophihabitans telluris]